MSFYTDFLAEIISRGREAVLKDYSPGEKRDGSLAGFAACQDLPLRDLLLLLDSAGISTRDAFNNEHEKYWWYRCYEVEVEWVCNCLSVLLLIQGKPPIIPPTIRAVQLVNRVLTLRGWDPELIQVIENI